MLDINLLGLQVSHDTAIERFEFDTAAGWRFAFEGLEWDLEAEFQLIAVSKPVPTIYSGKPRGRMMVGAPSVLVIYSVDTGGDGEGLRRHLRHRL